MLRAHHTLRFGASSALCTHSTIAALTTSSTHAVASATAVRPRNLCSPSSLRFTHSRHAVTSSRTTLTHSHALAAASSSSSSSSAAVLNARPLMKIHTSSTPLNRMVRINMYRTEWNEEEDTQRQQKEEDERNNDNNNNKKRNKPPPPPTSNPFRLFFRLLRRAFDWYAHKLDVHPIKTQSLTSGFLFLIGDLTAQRYEEVLDKEKGIDTSDRPYIDWLRLAACTSFGLFVLGPFGHHWYSRLDIVTNRLYPARSVKNVLLKVFLDTTIFNPIFLVVFFTTVSLIEGLTMKDIGKKLYRDFVPSYAVDCSVWPPIQTINFRFVPVKFQLLVVNLGCYFDDVFLSFVQHNGLPAIFQGIEKAWLEFIGDESVHGHGGHGHGHGHAKPAITAATPTTTTPLIEVLGKSGEQSVLLVPSDASHPHHPHSHTPQSPSNPPPAHHHLVPKILTESEHHLPRSHGHDVHVVAELDPDWTVVPLDKAEKEKLAAATATTTQKKEKETKK